jgi:hypothetical protein
MNDELPRTVSAIACAGAGRTKGTRSRAAFARVGSVIFLALSLGYLPAFAKEDPKAAPLKIAVFEFELDDESPAAALLNQGTSSASAMHRVSSEARLELARSGKYNVIDASGTDMNAVANKSFRSCDGCEAPIARALGADQALIGVVKRATQTDYYLWMQIRDARTGKILDQQAANFAGGEDGWASGARMLIRHQILVKQD